MKPRLAYHIALCLIIVFCFSIAHAAENQPIKKDEYDFSWLDPDKNIFVVQNRKYTKAKRLEVTCTIGAGISETYRKVQYINPRMIFYFNEHWGISGLYEKTFTQENDTFILLKKVTSVIPNTRDIENFYGASVVWVPFYSKLNFFNHIIYYDWYFELGAASITSKADLNTVSAGNPQIIRDTDTGFFFGTGHKYFLSKRLALRLELLMLRYTPREVFQGAELTITDTAYTYYAGVGLSITL